MAHAHDGGAHANRRLLAIALGLTGAFTVAEVVGGLLTGSLALLADAAHMFSDSVSLAVALFAGWLAARPASPTRTFGYKRAEILAALFNGVTLVMIAIWIFVEAGQRLSEPPDIEGGWMLLVAGLGLVVNIAAAAVLSRAEGESLNMSAALRHVLADLLGSLGVIVSAVVILTTGWTAADPLVSILIGLLVLASSWSVLRDSTRILLEGTPPGIDARDVGRAMAATPGVVEVHDLHIWTITSGFPALSAHVTVPADSDCHARRAELERMLEQRFEIGHTTLQVDHAARSGPLQVEDLRGPPRGG